MRLAAAAALLGLAVPCAAAEEATFTVKTITPEAAMKAAHAALARCRAEGFQVTVAVVDRSAVTQALVRDRFAAPQTVETAQRKAQTSVNFKMDTSALDRELQPGRPAAALRGQPNVVAVAGGVVIEAGGSLVGGIGVSGAPGPMNDDLCARAGLKAIAEDLEF
ncbi:MAG TPA: heme-binding protein [Usitatibacter sp.]|nr:heme-binding protein [Usitatibacter sp.]